MVIIKTFLRPTSNRAFHVAKLKWVLSFKIIMIELIKIDEQGNEIKMGEVPKNFKSFVFNYSTGVKKLVTELD